MIIGHMAKIAAAQLTAIDLGFLLVAVLAVGNASGRVVAGIVADKIGGTRTMFGVFVLQAVLMGALRSRGWRSQANKARTRQVPSKPQPSAVMAAA